MSSQQAHNSVLGVDNTVNMNAIPNTIPGVSREELAKRLAQMESLQKQKAHEAHVDNVAKEIDNMRRAMPPQQFKEFLENLEKKEAETAEEAEKVGKMSPTELYRYQLKKERREKRTQLINLIFLMTMFFGAIYIIFYFLIFFFY